MDTDLTARARAMLAGDAVLDIVAALPASKCRTRNMNRLREGERGCECCGRKLKPGQAALELETDIGRMLFGPECAVKVAAALAPTRKRFPCNYCGDTGTCEDDYGQRWRCDHCPGFGREVGLLSEGGAPVCPTHSDEEVARLLSEGTDR